MQKHWRFLFAFEIAFQLFPAFNDLIERVFHFRCRYPVFDGFDNLFLISSQLLQLFFVTVYRRIPGLSQLIDMFCVFLAKYLYQLRIHQVML
ncbi:MAG: hypothetical protein LZF84_04155 [Nitrosomonas sp.]|nr:MAG: hypothetical protein LZF84_04155 [Nitrosomonas sp.]